MNTNPEHFYQRAIPIGKLLLFFLVLNVFFVSIKLLGAFKGLGMGYGEKLIVELSQNPAIGLVIGILVTSIIQSSSTTTSLVVGLVAGGVFGDDPIQATQMAVPVIMGANVGTAVTSTLVSFGHVGNKTEFQRAFQAGIVHDFFNLLAVLVWFPVQVATNFIGRISLFCAEAFANIGGAKLANPFKAIISPQQKLVTNFFKSYDIAVRFIVILLLMICAFALLRFLTSRFYRSRPTMVIGAAGIFGLSALVTIVVQYSQQIFIPETAIFLSGLGVLLLSLFVIVTLMRSLIIERVERLFHDVIFKSDLRSLGLGILFTALVQSSSVTTSLTVPLVGAGIITVRQVFPFTLGANVGTTITALLAALAAGKPIGLAIAFAHLLFNILGILVWYPLKKLPIWLSGKLAVLASHTKAAPIGFIAITYFFIPLVLISILR